MLGGEIPVELLWGIPQAKQPFVLLHKSETSAHCPELPFRSIAPSFGTR